MLASRTEQEERQRRSSRIAWMAEAMELQLETVNLPAQSSLNVTVPEEECAKEEFQEALDAAVERCKAKRGSNHRKDDDDGVSAPKPSSFSLFDQLQQINQQDFGAMPMTMDDIQNATSAKERLQLLQRVEYLDDLLALEWKQTIVPMLRKDLVVVVKATTADSGAAERQESSLLSTSVELIALHRKWFDQGRSSEEYTPILYDLCENLLQAAVEQDNHNDDAAESNDSELNNELSAQRISLIQNWQSMWIDLMQRDQYHEDLAESMEDSAMALFFKDHHGSSETSHSQCILALLDPSAHWFYSWAVAVSPQHFMEVLMNKKGIFSDLWCQVLVPNTDINNQQVKIKSLQSNSLEWARCLHLTSVLAIILIQTRVSQFPWAWLAPGQEQPSDSSISKQRVMNLFLSTFQMLPETMHKEISYVKHCIWQGIDALLAGCQGDIDLRVQLEQTVKNHASKA